MTFIEKDTCTPIIIVVIGIAVVVYVKTLKHILISRCTDISFCCISFKRAVLSDEVANDIATQP
jgi:hypothetical protein